MNYEEALDYLQRRRRFGIKLGNERFETLLSCIDNPHRSLKVAHIAGTKGKGSTTAMIAAGLHADGRKVGSYFSPYVYELRERVQINGEMIPKEDFTELMTEIVPWVEDISSGYLGAITEFELKTAIGFLYFQRQAVDYAVVEVGLGGRLDATNVVTPLVSVITNIGLDHTRILGDTYAQIAYEKAGIIKPGIPVISAATHPEAVETIAQIANERKSPLLWVREMEDKEPPSPIAWCLDASQRLVIKTPAATYRPLQLNLKGRFQAANAACAVAAIEHMHHRYKSGVPETVLKGIERAYLPARFEVLRVKPTVILDGAHNAMAVSALLEELSTVRYRRLHIVLGMVTGHKPEEIVGQLAPIASHIYATAPDWRRAVPVKAIAEIARRYGAEVSEHTHPSSAVAEALSRC